MVYDITERKRTEWIAPNQGTFQMLVETSPMGLVLMVGGKVKYTNPGILDLLGMRMEDEVYDANSRRCFMKTIKRCFARTFAWWKWGRGRLTVRYA